MYNAEHLQKELEDWAIESNKKESTYQLGYTKIETKKDLLYVTGKLTFHATDSEPELVIIFNNSLVTNRLDNEDSYVLIGIDRQNENDMYEFTLDFSAPFGYFPRRSICLEKKT